MGNPPVVPGQPVERHDLAVVPLRLLRRDPEGERGAFRLQAGGLQRLACLERDRPREVVPTRLDRIRRAPEHLGALPGGELAGRLERPDGTRDRRLDLGGAGAVHEGDRRSVVGAAHLVGVAGGDVPAADERRELERCRNGRHRVDVLVDAAARTVARGYRERRPHGRGRTEYWLR